MKTERENLAPESRVGKYQKYLLVPVVFIILIVVAHQMVSADILHVGALLVAVTDSHTGRALDGAAVYIDGEYGGVTSDANGAGTLNISDIQQGTHTLRVTDIGYRPLLETFTYPGEPEIHITLLNSPLVPLTQENNNSQGINIVFVPSSTYFRTSDDSVVSTDAYTGNETQFREDVTRIINDTFDNLAAVTDPSVLLPKNYQNRLNFYYYFDSSSPADAFSGCAGYIPDSYWDNVTFSDLSVVLYPLYDGEYTNVSLQPIGCYINSGTGHKQMKIPANQETLAYHESGHGLYGLVDTYCGDTDYFENAPFPNVWSTQSECISSATADNRDPSGCRQIQSDPGDPDTCVKNFWRWDPDPDIMKTGDYGMFGAASTERIAYILNKSGGSQ
jgi:hypothetical protein